MVQTKRAKSKVSGTPIAKQARLTDSFRQVKRADAKSKKDGKKSTEEIERAVSQELPFSSADKEQEDSEEVDSQNELSYTTTAVPSESESLPEPEVHPPLNLKDKSYVSYLNTVRELDIADSIHQKGLSTVEKILKHFDLTDTYGPTVGMTRLQRWNRADKLGLNPPDLVFQILNTNEGRNQTKLKQGYLYGQL
ncbi:DNA polymerase delta, subunit 4 [Lipomyces arxii]|uniref:DNA polymerase delta, subunit 4 n=1 Tax=Lipomyces arxii TaxID=56418 RepID=UPI0034CF29DC